MGYQSELFSPPSPRVRLAAAASGMEGRGGPEWPSVCVCPAQARLSRKIRKLAALISRGATGGGGREAEEVVYAAGGWAATCVIGNWQLSIRA